MVEIVANRIEALEEVHGCGRASPAVVISIIAVTTIAVASVVILSNMLWKHQNQLQTKLPYLGPQQHHTVTCCIPNNGEPLSSVFFRFPDICKNVVISRVRNPKCLHLSWKHRTALLC